MNEHAKQRPKSCCSKNHDTRIAHRCEFDHSKHYSEDFACLPTVQLAKHQDHQFAKIKLNETTKKIIQIGWKFIQIEKKQKILQ